MPVPLRDTAGRRFRHAPPQPTGKRVRPRTRGLKWFEMLHRHGPLTTAFLHEFTRDQYPSIDGARDALKDFYNENSWVNKKEDEPYLIRPAEQNSGADARINEYVYDVSRSANKILEQEKLFRKNAAQVTHRIWDHDFALSCVTASIHIGTLGTDREFIFHDQIFDRIESRLPLSKKFQPVFEFPLEFSYRGKLLQKRLRPDRSCGIRFPDGTERLYMVEFDNDTESYWDVQGKFDNKTFELNVQMYLEFIAKGQYKKYFGPNVGLRVLFVFSKVERMKKMMEIVERMSGGKGASFLLFNSWTTFASNDFKPPKPRPDLYTDFWYRSVHPPFLICNP